MMDAADKEHYRLLALDAQNDADRYHKLKIEAEDMDAHDLWETLENRARLKANLALSVLEEDDE